MADAQKRYQGPTDSKWLPTLEFPIGSKAFVKARYFQTTQPSKKLADKFLGPYEVIAQPGTLSVTLWLPDSLCAVHPVFHVSMLEPAIPDPIPGQVQPPPPSIMVDDQPEFEIAEILDSKIDNCCQHCRLLYLVHWSGYEGTDEETSWILTTELTHAPEILTDFHAAYPAKPGPLASL